MEKRTQLTLFLKANDALPFEGIRHIFNPVQYGLIKSHITLCREDELLDMDLIAANLAQLNRDSVTITLGPPTRFSEGKGVYISGKGNNEAFHDLRALVLNGVIDLPRRHEPHITLIHPRNGTCTDTIFEVILKENWPTELTFSQISLITQIQGGAWETVSEFEIG